MNIIREPEVVRRIDASGEVGLTKAEYDTFIEQQCPDHDLVIDGEASKVWKRPTTTSALVAVTIRRAERRILERLVKAFVLKRPSLSAADLDVHERSIRTARGKVEFRTKEDGLVGPAVLVFKQGDVPQDNVWSFAPKDGLRWCLLRPVREVGTIEPAESSAAGIAIHCRYALYLLDERVVVVSIEIENPVDRSMMIKRFELDIGTHTLGTCDGLSCLPGYSDDVGWLQRLSLDLPARGARTGTQAFEIDDSDATLVSPGGVDASLWAVLIGDEGIECKIRVLRERPRI